MTPALVTERLGKRYGRRWALHDCTLAIPAGAVAGLAGANGAGKSTLLSLAAGLLRPSEGSVSVLGREVRADPELLAAVGYVAEDAPLYRSFTVGDVVELGRRTNRRWDGEIVADCLAGLRTDERVGALSPGQRARVALAIALGKQPLLLLVDEPFARLDPRAGREFLQLLMEGVAETGATVVLATHVVADLERVCDHVVLLGDGRARLAGNVDDLLASHRLLTGARRPLRGVAGVDEIVRESHSGRQMTLLARVAHPIADRSWSVGEVGLEELLLAYMAPDATPEPPSTPPRLLQWHG
jgi:ABC-2 type transport system ATP-binding protein